MSTFATVELDIKKAFIQKLQTAFPITKIFTENAPSQQACSSEVPFFEVLFIPTDTQAFSIMADGYDVFSGITQVNICGLANSGEKLILEALGLIRISGFTTGQYVEYNNLKCLITKTHRSVGWLSGPWYKIALSVYWKAYLKRN